MAASRATVSSSAFKWKPVASDVPQGSVLRPIQFSIFTSDTYGGIEYTLSEFATRLSGAVNIRWREGMSSRGSWVAGSCPWVVTVPQYRYRLGDESIASSPAERTWGY